MAKIYRIEIPYFDGSNCLVADNISKKSELSYCENVRSKTIGTIEKRAGTRRLGDSITATANYGIFYFENSTATGFFRISKVSNVTSIYYLNSSANWTILSGGGTSLTAAQFSHSIAEECCFLVNGTDANRYIGSDGTTVTVATTVSVTNHLYSSPIAYKINYYKDRLYLGDYTATTRYRNGIMMSSTPLGIVSLVDGDHANIAIGSEIKVTDLKYIKSADTLDVYRAGTKIADITINAKNINTNTITIATVTMAEGTDFKSSDEIWVNGTYTGNRIFRWADNPESGIDVKQYDTFKLSGGQNDSINIFTNIGDVMMIGNKNNLGVWNDYALKNFDLGIGCVSKNGYVQSLGMLFFVHYTGIYSTSGDTPRLISSKVQKYIDGATTAGLNASAAGKRGMSVFFAIGDVTLYYPDGSTDKTILDIVLEYDLRTTNWYVHSGITATQFATYIHSTNPDRLEYASTDTNYHIKEFLVDDSLVDDDQSGSDKEILFKAETSNITLSKEFEKIAYPQNVIIESERGSGIQCFVSLDSGRWYELKGTARKGCTILKVHNITENDNSPPRCRTIKLSLRDYTKARCKIPKVAITFQLSLEEENKRDINYGN